MIMIKNTRLTIRGTSLNKNLSCKTSRGQSPRFNKLINQNSER